MRRRLLRVGAVAAGAVVLLLAVPGTAAAHPLGNFTVNRYSGLVVAADGVTVDHVLDLAEIPTAQRVSSADTGGDGSLSPAELATYADGECRDAAGGMRLTVGGRSAALQVTTAAARAQPGQAGLPTLRLECALHASGQITSTTRLAFTDESADHDLGWREVTARGDGTTLTGSDVPEVSRSRRLTAYPKDLLSSPLDIRSATLQVQPGGDRLASAADVAGDTPVASADDSAAASVAGGLAGALDGLVARYDGSLPLAVTALLAALVLGAGHAVAPGHGKTVMAFYLSGRRTDSVRAAATVGATVTATHTAGVLALGLLVSAGTSFVPARVYPWLTAVSGLLVVAVGVTLLRETGRPHTHVGGHVPELVAATTARDRSHVHTEHHGHAHHNHPHHDHPHPHVDGSATAAQSRRGLVAMGLAGGLLPSPSALVVFLGALALGHPWFGVLLVVAFGLGMAATLAAVGLVVVRLRGQLEHRLVRRGPSRLAPVVRLLPLFTASGVVVLGGAIALRGLAGIG